MFDRPRVRVQIGDPMGKVVPAIAATALVASALAAPARAENGNIAAGVVVGLLGGALIGGAIAARPAPPPPVYYAPAPVYVEEPACRWTRERFWDGLAGNIETFMFAIDASPRRFCLKA